MSEKPLCGHYYNECTDNCCDKRKIDVLERQLAEAREEVKKAVKQGFDAMCDGGFCPITFDEFWARSEFNKLKEN